MHITIDERDRRPIYQQIVDQIKRLIARGELCENAALPPVRQVAADLGVNFNTIAAAYRELQGEGLIDVRHGSGAVVTSRQANKQPADQLRAPLRTALTQLVLAGHPKAQVLRIVTEELSALLKRTE